MEPRRSRLGALRIALFIACFNDTLFPETGKAVVRLLERLGHEVVFPEEQTCCGQMHANSGYQLEAVPLARRFVRVFGEYDAIVTPSGSCAAMVRDGYPRLAELAEDDRLAGEVDAVRPRVHELSELLVDVLGVEDVGAYFPHRVTYHPTCHGLRLLKVGDRPLRLLRQVRGIDLVELPEAETCCGFGGTFAVKNADTSAAMLTDKLRGGARHARGDLHRAGQLVPAAHRRRALPRAGRHADGAPRRDPRLDGGRVTGDGFPAAAREALANTQQRRNLGHATRTIRAKRAAVVGEVADWEALRDAGAAIKASAMARLPELLEQLEASVRAAGGQVHWARDGAEANAILTGIVKAHGATEVVKVKSLASDEIEMNEALAAEGITAQETDLAELIVQLGDDEQSHILVPAIHRNRAEIRELFRRTLDDAGDLSDDPAELAEAARRHLRKRFLSRPGRASAARTSPSRTTGTVCVVESEGNGRMCTTLPRRPRDGHGHREGRPGASRTSR